MILNAFFISLAGFYLNIETKENTVTIIKGLGLGNMVISFLCTDVCFGLNGALETLVAQAYGASQDGDQIYKNQMRMLCGRYLNLARLTLTVFMILPKVVLLLFADEILITFFKQNSKVSEIAIQYCIISLPGVWALTQYDATKRYLNALQFGKLPVLTQVITSCV